MLQKDPTKRPSIEEILDRPFMREGKKTLMLKATKIVRNMKSRKPGSAGPGERASTPLSSSGPTVALAASSIVSRAPTEKKAPPSLSSELDSTLRDFISAASPVASSGPAAAHPRVQVQLGSVQAHGQSGPQSSRSNTATPSPREAALPPAHGGASSHASAHAPLSTRSTSSASGRGTPSGYASDDRSGADSERDHRRALRETDTPSPLADGSPDKQRAFSPRESLIELRKKKREEEIARRHEELKQAGRAVYADSVRAREMTRSQFRESAVDDRPPSATSGVGRRPHSRPGSSASVGAVPHAMGNGVGSRELRLGPASSESSISSYDSAPDMYGSDDESVGRLCCVV